jgi:negative regulator of flagellin synthesis FlgM
MANTINGYSGSGAASVTSNRTSQSSGSNATATSTSSTTASQDTAQSSSQGEVQITSTASQLASLGAKLSAQPAINQAKVAQISKALANGTYTISADKIASGLMQSDQTLAQIGIE